MYTGASMAAPATATTVTVVVQTVAAAAPSVEGRNIGSAGELILIPWKLSRFKSDYIKFRAFVRFWLMQGYRSRSYGKDPRFTTASNPKGVRMYATRRDQKNY